MRYIVRLAAFVVMVGSLLMPAAKATTIPRLSFEELVDTSDMVISGRVTRAWAAWDDNHKYIWTHYELSVAAAQKGAPGSTIEFAEPGGALDGLALTIPGSVVYQPGEQVLVFLQRMPNGYLRTTGWGQGKYGIDGNEKLRADSTLRGLDVMDTKTARATATSLRSLEGMSLGDVTARVTARVRAGQRSGRNQ